MSNNSNRIQVSNRFTSQIDKVFDDFTGTLAGVVPGYARRDGQVQLAHDVDAAFAGAHVLLAEGPTGVGKSFAYGVPAILHAATTGRPALIVTANKALQEQLAEKDLPLLAKALQGVLDGGFSFKLLKGRSNYLCKRDLALLDSRSLNWPSGVENEGDAISAWAQAEPCSGDRADAPVGVSDKAWRAVSTSGDDCDHNACQHYQTCHAERVTGEAQRAHVVIANYDLFYSKLLYSGDPLWQKFGFIILDEAHEAASIGRRCFGREVSEWTFRRLATTLNDKLGEREVAAQLRKTVAPLFERIARYAVGAGGGRLQDPGFVNVNDLCEALDEAGKVAAGSCGMCVEGENCLQCNTRTLIRERVRDVTKDVKAFVNQSDDTTAYWFDKPMDTARVTGSTVKLCAAPYHVGDQLKKHVFDKYPSVVCVSATLAAGGSFDFIRNELGLTDPASTARTRTLRVPSPFDYAKQAKFVIPLGIPFPTSENEAIFDAAAAKALIQIIQECKGRTLALFTSWRRLKYIADQLKDKIDYPLLVQGDGPNKILAQMFREQTDSVLLATRSFWMGLDVSGESLSCLVIDKLPFESFDDPFVDMMKAKHPDTFYDNFYVPRATIALAQGVGRLIRSTTDHGVFVLLDQRIKAKRYGRQFLASLPFKGFSQDLADAGKFLANGGSR
jgi:ATP-dependent DNA helicase DinG